MRPIGRKDWTVIRELFGKNGACGGCWCMWWRVPQGGKLWEESKGRRNQLAFRKLLEAGRVHGCLAFHDDTPVGWCCVGPRADFPRLERTKALKTDWGEKTWSITCFYIKAGWRHRGLAGKLLAQAIQIARRHGAREIEGYPVVPKTDGDIPAAFAWTGVPRVFEKNRFVEITSPQNPRPVYRRKVRPA